MLKVQNSPKFNRSTSTISSFSTVSSYNEDDDEDLDLISIGSSVFQDHVRECLEKDPHERTEEDIEILMEFTHTLDAFCDLTHGVRQKMCATMIFAVVEAKGTVILEFGEELDSWTVIINGSVRVDGHGHGSYELSTGKGFGVQPTIRQGSIFSYYSRALAPVWLRKFESTR